MQTAKLIMSRNKALNKSVNKEVPSSAGAGKQQNGKRRNGRLPGSLEKLTGSLGRLGASVSH